MIDRHDATESEPPHPVPEATAPIWGWGLALSCAAALAAGAWCLWAPQAWLAEKWQAELEQAPDAEVATRIEQLAQLGDAGIVPLVAALGSPRQAIAEAARRELGEQLDQWELLAAGESSEKIALLVRAMKARAGQWSPRPLRTAGELAHRALRWRLDGQSPAAMEIVAGCETILRASAAANRPAAAPVSLAAFSGDPAAGNPREAGWQGAPESDLLFRQADFHDPPHPPSADLPLDVFPLPAPPPWPNTDQRGPPDQAALDAHREAGDAGHSPPREGEPALLSPLPGRPVPLSEASAPAPPDAAPNRPRATASSSELLRLVAVMKRLHGVDRQQVAQAEHELRREGFDDLRLELARRITDPDPAKRREIAAQLPRVSGLDARPWLLALVADLDPSVAAAASQVLATSADPRLQSAAREGLQR